MTLLTSEIRKNECIIYDTRCRYCGGDAVYYEKEHESRRISKVFFEELDRPWEKHLCKAFLNTEKAEVHVGGASRMNIYWVKRGYDNWYRVDSVSEAIISARYVGVYILWYFDGSGIARTVRVGEGCINEGIKTARQDPEVQQYAERGLYATWALGHDCHRKRIAVSLSQKLQPFVGPRYPDLDPGVFVGLPSKIRWYE